MHESDTAPMIRVRPWPDPVIDTLGHDPRSLYAERFWLPTLGPTALLVLRHLAREFEMYPDLELHEFPLASLAVALGLGPRDGKNTPLARSFERLVQFDLAYAHVDDTIAVRRNLPPIGRRHRRRLPQRLVEEHRRWVEASDAPRQLVERRARRVAFTLVETGEDVDVAEQTLERLGFPPLICRDAVTWAQARHRAAERASSSPAPLPAA